MSRLGGTQSGVRVTLTGFDEFRRELPEFTSRMVDAAARKAVRAAAKPIIAQARANVAALNLKESTGLLRQSIGVKVKKYRARGAALGFQGTPGAARIAARAGTTVAIIGPRHGYKTMVRRGGRSVFSNPAKYAHLIEGGVAPHFIGKGSQRVRGSRRSTGGMHPGFPAKPFMEVALLARRAEAQRILASSFAESLRQEAARARAKIAAARPRRAA